MKLCFLWLWVAVTAIISFILPSVGTAASPKIAAGDYHTLAIHEDGSLWAWGRNSSGQLGLGDTKERHIPTWVGTATNWVAVAAGGMHSLGLKSDGSLWAWGVNFYGQLGLGTADYTIHSTPTRVGTDADWAAISAGFTHSLALKTNGSLWGWGANHYGQLGLGYTEQFVTPTPVSYANWSAVAAGGEHSLCLRSDGTLWACGDNTCGQLGLGTTDNNAHPFLNQVEGAAVWKSMSAGNYHSLGVKINSELWGWGYNNEGELGLGNIGEIAHPFPTRVGSDNNWMVVSGGGNHSLGLKADGSLWAWGYNEDSQLGLGINDWAVPVPSRVGTGVNWVAISAGNYHSLGLKADNSIWAWGFNLYGQLGRGGTANQSRPIKVWPNFSPGAEMLLLLK